ncbi:cystathionine gamma-lyase [Chelonus insularis]|uniref:cystathionine gamma-lyase n=1 Tax=Chelonus insularis TaxID=460826 RepID=UPI00158A4397|nr:cystathionine gamma-lyase [Chelonus insularis]XP_034944961.1 cystathionine gamma-lyase [Chelonus insularis]
MPTNIEEGFATKAIHAGQDPQQWNYYPAVGPIVMSTTFRQDGPGDHQGFDYGRSGNPTRNMLETCLAAIENGKHALTFASGLGAVTSLTALLQAGDHIICVDDVYGGTNRYFKHCLAKNNIKITFADGTNIKNFINTIQDNTKMVWIETPTNPLLKLIDIRAAVDAIKAIRSDIIVVVDNSFLTCYFQKPLELGADIVLYSITKYMNGHSDVVMGAAILRSDELEKKLRFIQNALGIIPSPFDCSQVSRSLKTLEVRMKQHMKGGLAVAKFLESHPHVERVFHPLLPSHPQYELAKKQMTGHSGMVTFYLKGDSAKFLKALKIFIIAESLGGYESLAELPSVMTHASLSQETRDELGINDQLIRLSVGLETESDLIADLDQALKAAQL